MLHKEFLESFRNPSKEFSPAPLWFWYGKLNKDELLRQIDEMVDKGVYNAFMHPRAYLVTQYLEDEWWDAVDHVIEYSNKKGFHPWLYDEYAWPSGTCGSTFRYSCQKPSRVLAEGECNMAKGLKYEILDIKEASSLKNSKEELYAIIILKKDENGKIIDDSLKLSNIAELEGINTAEADFKIVIFKRYVIPTAVDYLNKKTISTFIKLTHEEYKKRYGKYFGTLIPGVFFDEIFNAADKIVWTDSFPEEFFKIKGYDIKKYLPLLFSEGGEMTTKVRKDYYGVVASLYEEAFFEAIGNWCTDNKLLLTGHTEEELKQHPLRQGNYFKTMRHLNIPGGDCHDYRYKYPRKITPIEPKGAVSVGRLNNRKRLMSEAMGGGGWATSLQEYKRGINVLAAMGINFFVLHGFYSETDHQGSQADWPQSFFFQNPYWKNFKVFADYISRLSFMGSYGKPVVNVGLLYPIEQIYERFEDGKVNEEGEKIADTYNTILETLLNNQIDTDVIDEESIRKAVVDSGSMKTGEEEFKVIIIPDSEGLEMDVLHKLKDFEENGGIVLLYKCSNRHLPVDFFSNIKYIENIENDLVKAVRIATKLDFEIIDGDRDNIYYYHRKSQDRDYYLIVNSCDKEAKIIGKFRSKGTPSLLNIESGIRTDIQYYTLDDEATLINMTLQEDEAVFVVFEDFKDKEAGTNSYNDESTLEVNISDNNWTVMPIHGNFSDNVPEGNDTEIKITTALFSSDIDQKTRRIRIQNREGERGNCGRHLSLWKASWITRRPSWSDESCEKSLYFRKAIKIEKRVKSARVCITAVNTFHLYVNGTKVYSGDGWRRPEELDISRFLKEGLNLIAVKVTNNTPVQGKNMLETEHFNPDTLTSLLLEGYIETEAGVVQLDTDNTWITCSEYNPGWESLNLKAEETAAFINVKEISYPWDIENKNKWINAWERGIPPIQPWGRLPLFGKGVTFPVNLKYEFNLPIGTEKIYLPSVEGEFSASLDGKAIQDNEWKDGFIRICEKNRKHTFSVYVKAESFKCGITEPLNVLMTRTDCNFDDWQERGLEFYSGYMLYETYFDLNDKYDYKYLIELGTVNFQAEVWVNGKKAGVKLWKPYIFDISSFIQEGRNKISIVVSNLAANKMRISLLDEGCAMGWNRYWYKDNIDRDSQNLISGLFGPVKIITH